MNAMFYLTFWSSQRIQLLIIIQSIYLRKNEKLSSYRFSGITEVLLENVTMTLEDAQTKFLQLVHEDTILIGHSLENDLRALKVKIFI